MSVTTVLPTADKSLFLISTLIQVLLYICRRIEIFWVLFAPPFVGVRIWKILYLLFHIFNTFTAPNGLTIISRRLSVGTNVIIFFFFLFRMTRQQIYLRISFPMLGLLQLTQNVRVKNSSLLAMI